MRLWAPELHVVVFSHKKIQNMKSRKHWTTAQLKSFHSTALAELCATYLGSSSWWAGGLGDGDRWFAGSLTGVYDLTGGSLLFSYSTVIEKSCSFNWKVLQQLNYLWILISKIELLFQKKKEIFFYITCRCRLCAE